MSLIVRVDNIIQKEEKPNFPQLMIADDFHIILVTEENGDSYTGITVSAGNSPNVVGLYSTWWKKGAFKKFHGSITLLQD